METNKEKLTNFTPINNNILKQILLTRLSECELKTLLLIFRKTAGNQQKIYCNLSYSYIKKCIPFSERAIIYAIRNLEKRHIIVNYKKPGGKINQWAINSKLSMWQDTATHCREEIKGKSKGTATHCREEIKGSVFSSNTATNTATHCREGTATHCREGTATHCREEKNIYKKNNIIIKKEEPKPQNNLEKDIEIFLRNMERLEKDETSGAIQKV